MKILKDIPTVQTPTAAFPKGFIIDGTSIVGEAINQDMIQFFQGLADEVGITENDLVENKTNGYQLHEALRYFANVIKSSIVNISIAGNQINLSGKTIADLRKTIRITGGGILNEIVGFPTPGLYNGISFKAHIIDDISINSGTGANDIELINIDQLYIKGGSIVEFFYNINRSTWYIQQHQPSSNLIEKTINIGDWVITGGSTVSIPHMVSNYENIRGIDVMIRMDPTGSFPNAYFPVGEATLINYSIQYVDATNIGLICNFVAIASDWNQTSFNRGYVTIKYLPF